MGYAALVRVCVWIGATALAYVLAFSVASIVDSVLLKPLQSVAEASLIRFQHDSQ